MSQQSKRWCFTLNNPTDADETDLSLLPVTYLIYQPERGADGTDHYQGYMMFKTNQRLSAVKKLLPRAHLEIAKGTSAQCILYCTKDDTSTGWPVERGTRPETQGIGNQKRWANVKELAECGQLDDLIEVLGPTHFRLCKTLVAEYGPISQNLPGYCGLWIHGPPGVGKTTAVDAAFPNRYRKPLNKWWDGYKGQEVVHMDELNPDNLLRSNLTENLKLWGDKFCFAAEVKGSQLLIRPRQLIVTSNYSIEQMGFRAVDETAIKLRFKQVLKSTREQDIIFLE